jgi:hypothetical protein
MAHFAEVSIIGAIDPMSGNLIEVPGGATSYVNLDNVDYIKHVELAGGSAAEGTLVAIGGGLYVVGQSVAYFYNEAGQKAPVVPVVIEAPEPPRLIAIGGANEDALKAFEQFAQDYNI